MANFQTKASAEGYFLQSGESGLKSFLRKELNNGNITEDEAEELFSTYAGTYGGFVQNKKTTEKTFEQKNNGQVKTSTPKTPEIIKTPSPAVSLTKKDEKEMKERENNEGNRRNETNMNATSEKTASSSTTPKSDKTFDYEEKYAGMDYAKLGNEAARIEAEFLTGARSEIDYDEVEWLRNQSRANAPNEVIAFHRDKALDKEKEASNKAKAQKSTVSYSPQREGAWLIDQSKNDARAKKRKHYEKLASDYKDEANNYQQILDERGVSYQYPREATFKDITVNSFNKGYYTRDLGEESYKDMMGVTNNYDYYDQLLKSDKYNFKTDNWGEKILSGAAEFLGNQYHQWSNPEALAAGSALAGTAALAGQAGPQVLLPEEAITVPAAFLLGHTTYQAKSAFEVEAGLAYREMIDNGIDHDTAVKISLGIGAVNSLLETVQIGDLVKSFKIFNLSDSTKPLAKKIYSVIAKRLKNAAVETGEEVLQEGVTIGGVNLGGMIENGKPVYDLKESASRLGDTALSSFIDYLTIGSAGDAINHSQGGSSTVKGYYSDIFNNPYDAKARSKIQKMSETERVFAKAGANAENISTAVIRAQGVPYDGNKEIEAYEYGLEQRKRGNGQELDLLIDATDYLDRNPDSEILSDFAEEAGIDKNETDDIMVSGARITEPYSEAGDLFAESYYEEVRHYTTDVKHISDNLNLDFNDIREIKAYLFEENSLYDENSGKWVRFYPDCAIAHSWQRLMQGKDIKPHDITFIKHELYELEIKKSNVGISHAEAHKIASLKYNYQKEAEDYYASLKKHK